jgi:hypothetical protein
MPLALYMATIYMIIQLLLLEFGSLMILGDCIFSLTTYLDPWRLASVPRVSLSDWLRTFLKIIFWRVTQVIFALDKELANTLFATFFFLCVVTYWVSRSLGVIFNNCEGTKLVSHGDILPNLTLDVIIEIALDTLWPINDMASCSLSLTCCR